MSGRKNECESPEKNNCTDFLAVRFPVNRQVVIVTAKGQRCRRMFLDNLTVEEILGLFLGLDVLRNRGEKG